ncbi:MAG: (Fe-S)-binding protein [bacterium]
MFDADLCDLCGDCLVRCPELALGRAEAQAEIGRLIRGADSKVLTSCSSCFSCNTYCPRDCKPYHLILARWNDRYRRLGSPAVWKFLFPTEKENLWSLMHALLPAPAKDAVESWMTARPGETVFLPGSFFHLVPEILSGSRLLEGMTVLDLPGHWECGAYLCQGGYLDLVAEIGRMVRDDLDRWGVRRVVPALDSVHYLFTRFHPEENGIRFGQEIVAFHAQVIERILKGEIRRERGLGLTATVHDNCYAKAESDRCFEEARWLLEWAGVRVVEMRHHHADALCCGFGRGAGWSKGFLVPMDILKGTMKRIREAEETGAGTLVTYCAGCLWLFLAARELMSSPVRIVHLIELVREAMGEEVRFPRTERAWDILAAMSFKILRETGNRNVWIPGVASTTDPADWSARPQRLLRGFRKALGAPPVQEAFRRAFQGAVRVARLSQL